MEVDELQAWLEELRNQPEPQAPWGLRWLDKLTAPENPWILRCLLTGAAVFYALGLIVGSVYGVAAIGLLMFAWPVWEDRSKLLRDQRIAKERADLNAWEAAYRAAWHAAKLERLITPDWMR